MFGLFKKKEPEKQTGPFKEVDYCNDCKKLQEYDEFGACCPDCGSVNHNKVIARWKYHWTRTPGFMCRRVNDEYEIKT